ncbi:DUF1614 domain-containing protein [Bradyrhizobium sp. CNPSo 4026]|nr:DUF1614 domain-containing protein [Bradyrhizobium cenepequi]
MRYHLIETLAIRNDLDLLTRWGSLGAPIASIGGAGTFDGIFLTGILAVLLAAIASRSQLRRFIEKDGVDSGAITDSCTAAIVAAAAYDPRAAQIIVSIERFDNNDPLD